MISRVSPADGGRISASLTSRGESISAGSDTECGRVHSVPGEGLEVQPGGHFRESNRIEKKNLSWQMSSEHLAIVKEQEPALAGVKVLGYPGFLM